MRALSYLVLELMPKLHSKVLKWAFKDSLTIGGRLRLGKGVVIRSQRTKGGKYADLQVITEGANTIGSGTIIQGSGDIYLGARSFIGPYCSIGCYQEIRIGQNVMIAQAVAIQDNDHTFDRRDIPMVQQGLVCAPVEIGDDVWIGTGASIISGISIGCGAVISANAHVVKDVLPYQIVGGNPSKVLRNRFEDEIKDLLIELRWWDLPLADIKQIKRELCANPTKEILLKLIKNYRQ